MLISLLLQLPFLHSNHTLTVWVGKKEILRENRCISFPKMLAIRLFTAECCSAFYVSCCLVVFINK